MFKMVSKKSGYMSDKNHRISRTSSLKMSIINVIVTRHVL
jgi:hypothetical protein